YGPIFPMSKLDAQNIRPRLTRLLIALMLIVYFYPLYGHAVDRISYVSVGTMVPVEIKPEKKLADFTYSVKFSVFFEDTIASLFGIDIGTTDSERLAFVAGVQWYLAESNLLDPYVTFNFLYKLNGQNKPGWRSTIGAEWNAHKISKLDNFRIFAETGASYIFDQDHQIWFEVLHLGAAWHF
ncbi:MAG: hypothetical protein KDD48_07645, partial [Bdellovibrionales bacterium]|nr:hypothetical protein [Bdellovibrionales bacterium]